MGPYGKRRASEEKMRGGGGGGLPLSRRCFCSGPPIGSLEQARVDCN